MRVLSFLYSAITLVLSPVALALLMTSRRGRARWRERLGQWEIEEGDYLWFHGASAGEVAGLLPLIKAITSEGFEERVLITATSVTGLEMGAAVTSHRHLLPFDSSLWYSCIFSKITPKAAIISETELWPALYFELRRRGVPLLLVNSRISDTTYPRYSRFRFLLKEMLSIPSLICTGDDISKERFRALGAGEKQVVVTGNTKYDVDLGVDKEGIEKLRLEFWQDNLPVILLGSIRPEEDDYWFSPLKEAIDRGERFHLIVAPRHKEKFDYFAGVLATTFGDFDRRSSLKGTSRTPRTDILLLDTFGELRKLYALADLSFIGASLIPIGGHNPLEASMYGSYVVMGPHYHVVKEVVDELRDNDAGEIVHTREDIENLLERFFASREMFRSRGREGVAVWGRHKGASARVVTHLKGILAHG